MKTQYPAIVTILILGLLVAPRSTHAQGFDERELQQWTEHIFELERRVARRGDDVQLMIRLTDAYIRIGDARRAGPALERLSDLGVEPLRIALFRGDLHMNLEEYDQAARSYLDALSHAEGQPYALSQLWRLMLRVTLSGQEINFDRTSVIETLQREGLIFPPDYSPTPDGPQRAARHIDRAGMLLRRNRAEEAVMLLRRAISLDPGNADAFAVLARAYAANNDTAAAIGASLVYLLLAPDAPDAHRMRLYMSRELERANLR